MSRSVAVALGYRPEADLAPHVLAAGAGEVAERIRRIAAAHDIPLEEDHDLAERLFDLEVGDELPEDLYLVVARIFAYLDTIARKVEAAETGATGEDDQSRPTTRVPAT